MGELMERKVLIVDDEERVVQSIAGVLEDEGFRVAKAKSGEEAIKVFQQEEPDVTLLDIWMPGMDGIETVQVDCPRVPSDYDLRSCNDFNCHDRCKIGSFRLH
jgi:DNA-binding NtrC family response regulator